MTESEPNWLIKNSLVIQPHQTSQQDVLVSAGRISKIAPEIADTEADVNASQVIDGSGKYLMPGVIDDQVHFRTPGLEHKEDFEHATRACAKGGVTSFLEMPNTNPTTTTCQRLAEKLDLASGRCLVNFGFYMGATEHNIEELKNAKRTPGIKIFIGSSTGELLVDDQAALERIFAETSLPICAHCEDETMIQRNEEAYANSTDVADHSRIRDHEVAITATRRAVDLAVRHQHPFHVLHLSTFDEVAVVESGAPYVTAEVCPHHLFFNTEDYARLGSLIKMNPSIKSAEDNQKLWQALVEGKIQIVATDHAPHTLEEKAQSFPACPSGLPAVENLLALMLNQVAAGKCSVEQVARWLCEAPARVWNVKNKGRIQLGFDADLALVDLDLKQTVLNENQQTKNRWSPWHGMELTGWPVQTWVHGIEVFRRDNNGSEWFHPEFVGREIEFERDS